MDDEARAKGAFGEAARAAVYRAIYERRDVRNYRPDPVPEDVLGRILAAAHQAPSVGFMQPWHFVLLRDRTVRAAVYEHFVEVNARAAEVWRDERKRKYQALKLQGILDAPLNLLVACDPRSGGSEVLGRFTIKETDVYSTCLAVQNLWLAARAEGVGVGWMSIMEPAFVARLLALPEEVIPVAYLTIGYPIEFAEKPLLSQVGWQDRRPLSQQVFEDRWGRQSSSSCPKPLEVSAEQVSVFAPQTAPAPEVSEEALARNRALTKPEGSLGEVERLGLRLAALQQTAYPRCEHVHLTLFAGDHGVCEERVSPYKADTTLKLVYGYLAGAGVVNALARREGVALHVVDVGVDHDFGAARGLVAMKVRRGTRNFTREAAMTDDECAAARDAGKSVVAGLVALDVLALGEVGIGNSTSSAALAAALLSRDPEETTGRGTGIDDDGLVRKRAVIARALALHAAEPRTPTELLRRLGGFEIAALVGAIEAGAARGVMVVLDGVMTAVAAVIAVRENPVIRGYLMASHRSPEPAHRALLDELGTKPLLDLGMRLGEGSGAVMAVGFLRSACAVMREVRTFEEANIERPERRDP